MQGEPFDFRLAGDELVQLAVQLCDRFMTVSFRPSNFSQNTSKTVGFLSSFLDQNWSCPYVLDDYT